MTLRRICAADVTPLLPCLPSIVWPPSNGDCTMLQTRAVIESFLPAKDLDNLIANVMTAPDLRRHHVSTVFLSKVKSGGHIRSHADDLDGHWRIHVPLQTNNKCVFIYDDVSRNLQSGHAYELNPSITHAVENGGDADRIHLLWNVC